MDILSECSILVLEGSIYVHFILFISIGVLMPSDSCVTSTAILISNPANDGPKIMNKEICRKNCDTLKMALSKGGWKCGMVLFRNG